VGSPSVIVNALSEAMRQSGVGGGGGSMTLNFSITALDVTDLRRKVEDEILPMAIDALEVNRNRSLTKLRNLTAESA